jgi:uncharacterized membrane protein (Fun14 family)
MALKEKRKASISGDRSIHVTYLAFSYTLKREIKIKIKIVLQYQGSLFWLQRDGGIQFGCCIPGLKHSLAKEETLQLEKRPMVAFHFEIA